MNDTFSCKSAIPSLFRKNSLVGIMAIEMRKNPTEACFRKLTYRYGTIQRRNFRSCKKPQLSYANGETFLNSFMWLKKISAVLGFFRLSGFFLLQTNSEKFIELKGRMYDLMRLRSEIISGTLPQDELREMEHLVAARIDLGNQ